MERAIKMPEEPSIVSIFEIIMYCFKNDDLNMTDVLSDYVVDICDKIYHIDVAKSDKDEAQKKELTPYKENFIQIYREKFFHFIIRQTLRLMKLSDKHIHFFQSRNIESDTEDVDSDFEQKNKERED